MQAKTGSGVASPAHTPPAGRRHHAHLVPSGLDLKKVHLTVELSLGDEAAGAEEADELQYALGLLGAARPPWVNYVREAFALELTYPEMGKLHGKSPMRCGCRWNGVCNWRENLSRGKRR